MASGKAGSKLFPASRPITEAETEQVRKLAGTCDSIFRRHEERVSGIDPGQGPVYADSPHEGCPCRFA